MSLLVFLLAFSQMLILQLNMVQKRPHSEELYEVSSKQPRRSESSDEMVSSLEFPDENVASNPHALGESGQFPAKVKSEYDEMLDGGNGAELRTCLEKELEASLPDSVSNSSWATSTTSEEDIRSEAPFHIVLSPDHHNLVHPTRAIIHVGDIYSSLLEYPPLKPVPVGKDFQAEIPEWASLGTEQKSVCLGDVSEALNVPSQSSKSDICGDLDDESRLPGTCIIPMPELDMSKNVEKVRAGRINCSCEDEGSIRCIQRHITEAREKLRATLGQETFDKLGFSDMGEAIAENWTEEEELIFHEVVANNPATLGKNFWDYLAMEFPSRTKKEIVSYYFNVFMLRKRALQNRYDPLNIDSDNDEWEGTDDSAEYVIENGKECNDPGVESPGYEDVFGRDEFHEDVQNSSEDGFPIISGSDEYKHLGDSKVICNVSENFPVAAFDNHGTFPTFFPSDRVLSNEQFHKDMHESSKDGAPETSGHDAYENFCDKVISNANESFSKEALDSHNTIPTFLPSDRFLTNEPGGQGVPGVECASDIAEMARGEVSSEGVNGQKQCCQEFLSEPSSSKEWDAGYLTHPKNEDFLPTCSMIEEVFGNEALNFKTTDG